MLLYGPPKSSEKKAESLFEYVARQNGPLPDYHPQMLLQCLLWGMVLLAGKNQHYQTVPDLIITYRGRFSLQSYILPSVLVFAQFLPSRYISSQNDRYSMSINR